MALTLGARLGPYEITAALGAGGMGEVYRARDAKLNRDVAVKILPEAFATDPERLARFRREAQLLASLNHPHIGAIYGFEEVNGVGALVLELVEGPTLADRIAQGPIPLDEALPMARQITDACEAAHAQGIIHRDLKPSNIKLRPDGVIKVLDFGLARATEATPTSADASQSPTITSPAMTRAGVILGTAAYMSPEQAKGRVADQRSDIWAFGCVLFEMLTGKRVFYGEDIVETLASILTKEPDWSLLPSDTPPSIRRLLRRCLERDRKRRLADMADARLELDEVATDGAGPVAPLVPPRRWIPWSIASVCAAIAIWLAVSTVFDRPADNTRVVRSSILLPSGLGVRPGSGAALALSPDGRRLVFVGGDTTGHRQLWMRTLDGSSPRPLADTENASSPFWSPDGRWLAFVADGKLKKLDPSGGQAVTLCESAVSGGAWNRDDIILFTQVDGPLAQVRASGGAPSTVTTLAAEDFRHAAPFFLPDGHHFGYVAFGLGYEVAVYVASLTSGEQTQLQLPLDVIFVQYAQGFLLFAQGSTLMAQRFDEQRNALVGTAVPVADHLRVDFGSRSRSFSVSATGVLVVQEDPSPGFELVWYDRQGRRTGTLGAAADYADVSLSPDGRRLLVSIAEQGTTNRDLWMFDVARGIRTRFTVSPEPETHNIWSPDGKRVVYDSLRKGHRDMFLKASDGSGDEEALLETEADENPMDWSPDGRFISYIRRSAQTVNIWMLPLEGDRKPFPFRESSFFEVGGLFSPDGRWVLYFSTESGRNEIFVSPFSRPGEKFQVSTAGGFDAMWGPAGKEIFYLSLDGKLMVAAVSTEGDQFRVGEVKPMFELLKIGPRWTYDMSPDGQRFIAVTRKWESVSAPLTLVDNWPELLER